MADRRDDDPLPTPPPPDVLHAFREQVTEALVDEAREFAESLVKNIRNVGRPVSPSTPLELVNTALGDTWQGSVTWDPAACSLLEHVRRLVWARARREIRHGAKFRHVAFDLEGDPDLREEVTQRSLSGATSFQAASCGDLNPILLASMVSLVVGDLRRLAGGHGGAQSLLKSWEDGITEKTEVMARTGLTSHQYNIARKRLLRAADRLPPDLREIVKELLRSAS